MGPLELQGKIDGIDDQAGSLPEEITLEDPVRFAWSFDRATPDTDADPAIGTYDPADGKVFVDVDGTRFVSCDGEGSLIDIVDGDPDAVAQPGLEEQDEYFVTGLGCANLPSGATVELAVMTLADQTELAITRDQLDQDALTPPDTGRLGREGDRGDGLRRGRPGLPGG